MFGGTYEDKDVQSPDPGDEHSPCRRVLAGRRQMPTGVHLRREGREERPRCTPAAGMLWDAAQNPALLSTLPFKPKLPKGTGVI